MVNRQTITPQQVLGKILSDVQVVKGVKEIVRQQFEQQKNNLLKNFDEHPVTQEMSSSNSANISNTLGGYGNLRGFLGIPSEENPVPSVRGVLNNQIKIKKITVSKAGSISIIWEAPNLKDFSSVAGLEWDTRNWVEGMERGISGFQYFMSVKKGRSGQGIQVTAGVRSSQFKNRKYMSELINNFKKSLSSSREF